jgi:hypothetical protein
MSIPIGRNHIVNLVLGNWDPFAIHFNFVMVAQHTTLGRPTILPNKVKKCPRTFGRHHGAG